MPRSLDQDPSLPHHPEVEPSPPWDQTEKRGGERREMALG